jgi:hypothetical protein
MAFRRKTRKTRKTMKKNRKSRNKSRHTRRGLFVGGISPGLCIHGKIKYNCPICKYKYVEF